jgi:hypothetical protein
MSAIVVNARVEHHVGSEGQSGYAGTAASWDGHRERALHVLKWISYPNV